jgi:hypothetical protein
MRAMPLPERWSTEMGYRGSLTSVGRSSCESEKSGRGRPKHFINTRMDLRVWISSHDNEEGSSVSSYWYRADSPSFLDLFIYLFKENLYRTENKSGAWWFLCVRREEVPKLSKAFVSESLKLNFLDWIANPEAGTLDNKNNLCFLDWIPLRKIRSFVVGRGDSGYRQIAGRPTKCDIHLVLMSQIDPEYWKTMFSLIQLEMVCCEWLNIAIILIWTPNENSM